MKTDIYCFSGTGNSLWVARKTAVLLGEAQVIPMPLAEKTRVSTDAEVVGLVFPVHIWGVPTRVRQFIQNADLQQCKYLFAVAVNAGQVAGTLIELADLCRKRNLTLANGFSVVMPSNYIPWGGAAPLECQQALFSTAQAKIQTIASAVQSRVAAPPEKGAFWENWLLSKFVHTLSAPQIPKMDKDFYIDENCRGCGCCAKACPAENITMSDGKPQWHHRCEQCFACLQWCPEDAVQFGRNTSGKKRYHHPEVSWTDVAKQK